MRTGAELIRATSPFAEEDRARTWRLLAVTLGCYAAAVTGAAFAPWLAARLAAAALAGLLLVRLFIFYHDHLHGAIFVRSSAGKLVMHAVGYWTLNGPSVWRQTHDYHHKHTAKIVGASIGSFPVVTRSMWQAMSPSERRAYRLVRHPANIALGYFTIFVWGMCLSAFRRDPRRHLDGLVALAVHFGGMALVGVGLGWDVALFAVFLPQFLTSGLGGYLFYAQHNFPDMRLRDRQDWDYAFAATRSSSMFDMPAVLHWFTGNIGYHHVHHLNHRVPFYRLPEAMAAVPELQDPGRTSWRPRDVAACLRLAVWDGASGRMLSFVEADGGGPVDAPLPAK